jgi:hypothetical protein
MRKEGVRRPAGSRAARFAVADQARQRGDLQQQLLHFAGGSGVVEGGDDLDRLREPAEVALELFLQVGVEH